jgi:hypothetical protein
MATTTDMVETIIGTTNFLNSDLNEASTLASIGKFTHFTSFPTARANK